jgi:hypothetical protein
MRRIIGHAAALAATLTLSACLISETPLLDAMNGKATPLDPGDYNACSVEEEGGEPDCKAMKVSRDETALYRFDAADEDEPTFARFRKIGTGAWVAQLSSEDDGSYFYFLSEAHGDEFVMALIDCEDIPKAVRDRYVKRGQMEVEDDATACNAKALAAVTGSAKAFRKAAPISTRARIIYTKAPTAS